MLFALLQSMQCRLGEFDNQLNLLQLRLSLGMNSYCQNIV